MLSPGVCARMVRGLVFTAALAVVFLTGRSASAFCGFYVSGADAKLFANATQVVLMREGTRTVLSMQNDYEGPPDGFAMVVPVPVVLQKENVKTLPREIFARIDQLDAPRLVEYWEQDPCMHQKQRLLTGPRGGGAPGAKPMAASGGKQLGVTIEAQFTVGEYEIVVLGAKDASGLEAWLHHEGYKIPGGSEPDLRPYVQSGSKFFVARVDVTKVKMESGKATLSPLRFHYDSAELSLPIRLGLVNSAGTQDLIVHVLGKGKRYEVANYPNVTIPTNLDVAENAKQDFGSFYAALFDHTVAKTPKAVVTEYAWDAASCDPCPSPVLTDSELVTLGADVLPSVSSEDPLAEGLLAALDGDGGKPKPKSRPPPPSGPVPSRTYYGLRSSFVLTRLHARYTREALGADLVLKEAPPITGGREIGNAPEGGLATGATVGTGQYATNNFQGRYAVRHPWTGPVECASPIRNVWGSPPSGIDNGGAKPALGLAYAPRQNVQLASFLRSNVAALDLQAAGSMPSGVGTSNTPAPSAPSPASADAGSDAGAPIDVKKPGCAGCTTSSSGASSAGSLLTLVALALAAAARRRRREDDRA